MTKIPLLISRYTMVLLSDRSDSAEVNRISAYAKSNTLFYPFNVLLFVLESK